jgi:hypothetical protein
MKKSLLFVVLLALVLTTPVLSQSLMDFVSRVSANGDTLVVKTQVEMLGEANALSNVIKMDTIDVPAGRVYLLMAGGVYPNQNNATGYAGRVTRVIGSDPTPLVQNHDALASPPLIVGFVGTTTNTGGIGSNGDLVVKNCALAPTADDGSMGWLFVGTNAAGNRREFDNCLFERTKWVEVGVFNANCSYFLSNCYFVNLNGLACRRNGGVYDGFANLDTFLVENTTHIMTQGSMYKWRNYTANRIIMNHNTFVNSAGIQFLDLGTQTNISYTNNLFVNANLQPYPDIRTIDNGELDLDWLPFGIVNVYPDSALEANSTARKFLVEGNNLWYSSAMTTIVSEVNALAVNGITNWHSQQILMNTRTKNMFDNDAAYPYLTEGTNYAVDPQFVDDKDLIGGKAETDIKAFTISTVDTASTAILPDWRLVNTGAFDFIYFDWPIPVNLAYTNSTLLTGAIGAGTNYPVGDLNWFPSDKTSWLAQRTAEYTAIQNKLDNSSSVEEASNVPKQIRLDQNYPNPFNPSTKITFSLKHSANTNLKVIDMLGREVATLVNGFTAAGSHEVQFNAANLASGVYYYKLTSGSFSEVKKMMLVK